jgi:hypothetical protein
LLALALVSSACRIVRGPAGFWKTYESGLITQSESDQGPWGGERSIVWHSDTPGTFTLDEARRFATSEGWKFLESSRYEGISNGRAARQAAQHIESREPEFLNTPSTIGRFDSDWLREDPGTGETSPAFGYVQVSDDGTDMYVYHFWGNG